MIEAKNISIDLGEFHLRNINLAINDGEYMVLLGPTGAGKTVLIECLIGIHRPATGRMIVRGTDVTGLYPEERNIGYVPQDYALFPNMTVKKNIAYGLHARKCPRDEVEAEARTMMKLLGIAHLHHRLPVHLSGGEQQRTALARALVTRPRILLLDEPLSALDENLSGELAAELRRIQRNVGGTFLHVCHSFEEASEVADRVAIMNQGTIAQVGTIDQVLSRPASLFVAQFTRTQNFCGGIAHETNTGCRIDLGEGLTIDSTYGRFRGPVTAAVRPEDIEILNGTPALGPEVLRGRVESMRRKATYTEVRLAASLPLIVYHPHQPGKAAPAPGDQIAVRLPPQAVKVFPIDQ